MIVIAGDHAAVEMKSFVIGLLQEKGYEVEDLGPNDSQSVDYPDYAKAVTDAVAEGRADQGILICGTGIGMSIAANQVSGIRAALVHNGTTARLAREHNDANVLCFGARIVGKEIARDIVSTWLDTPFSGAERHMLRLDKIRRMHN